MNKAEASTNSTKQNGVHEIRHIWIITGPAGCGKSTIGAHIADKLTLPYIEGDEVCAIHHLKYHRLTGLKNKQYHPQSNITKMASGHPLTDTDRWDWLILLRETAFTKLSHPNTTSVILTCSALKRKYRDVLRIAAYENPNIKVHFVFLKADEAMVLARVKARAGHFMKEEMVRGQFAMVEEPEGDEGDCFVVEVGGTMGEVQALALGVVEGALGRVVQTEGDGL